MTVQARTAKLLHPFASMLLAAGAIGSPVLATAATAQVQVAPVQTIAASAAEASDSTLSGQNGVYLFGEAPVRDQIGSAYLVLEVQDSSVVGGVYMPYSSFDCFQGEIEGNRLNLSIINSYDLSTYAYSIDLQSDSAVASTTPTAAPVELDGYHLISTVTDNDLRILETCKADF